MIGSYSRAPFFTHFRQGRCIKPLSAKGYLEAPSQLQVTFDKYDDAFLRGTFLITLKKSHNVLVNNHKMQANVKFTKH